MYLDFYKLYLKPFQISTDPKFLWLGEKHKEALAVLKYGILDNKGFLLLTGDVGTGKTTLVNSLINSLGDDVLVALVTDPGLAKMDFFNFVADSFEIEKKFKSKGDFLIYLKNFLLDINRQNKQTLLIIDECQQLNQKLLEEVRLLSNIEKYNTKLINIFFVGQSEFNDIILRPRNRAIRQRITINYNISALSESETDKYIRFRLRVAGSKEPVFTSRAIKEVFKFSNGYPRLINIICDQALLTGYVQEKRKINEKIVADCANELKIPYGSPMKKSLATPEAAEEKRDEVRSEQMAAGPAMDKKNGQFSRPLVIAFIVVLIIWIGLVIMFIVNQQRSDRIHSTGDAPVAFDIAARQIDQDKSPGPTDQTVAVLQTNEGSDNDSGSSVDNLQVEIKKPPEMPEKQASDKNEAPRTPVAVDVSSPAVDSGVTKDTAKENQPSTAATNGEGTENRISLQEIKEEFGEYPSVRFGFNSNKLDDGSYDILGLIARYCLQNPEAEIILRGYTDNSGVRAYNMKLSEFRADMVKTYLVGRGAKASKIKVIAMGPETVEPDGETTSNDESQRKVAIEIIQPNE